MWQSLWKKSLADPKNVKNDRGTSYLSLHPRETENLCSWFGYRGGRCGRSSIGGQRPILNPGPQAQILKHRELRPQEELSSQNLDHGELPRAKIRMFRLWGMQSLRIPFSWQTSLLSAYEPNVSGSFEYSPFLSMTDDNMPGARPAGCRTQARTISSFGMQEMLGGFTDMFGIWTTWLGTWNTWLRKATIRPFHPPLSSLIPIWVMVPPRSTRCQDALSTRQDQGDSEDHVAPGQETRDVHWTSHHRPGSHPSVLPKGTRSSRTTNPYESEAAIFDNECGGKHPNFRHSALWNFEGMRLQGVGTQGLRGLPLAIQGPEDSLSRQSCHYGWWGTWALSLFPIGWETVKSLPEITFSFPISIPILRLN